MMKRKWLYPLLCAALCLSVSACSGSASGSGSFSSGSSTASSQAESVDNTDTPSSASSAPESDTPSSVSSAPESDTPSSASTASEASDVSKSGTLTIDGTFVDGYWQVSQSEAMRLMEEERDYLIVDVREFDEFDTGHIPGAICIPNDSIVGAPEQLPDQDQLILIYCRSGNRSKKASAKLANLGYTRIVEFGGIITWTGAIES